MTIATSAVTTDQLLHQLQDAPLFLAQHPASSGGMRGLEGGSGPAVWRP